MKERGGVSSYLSILDERGGEGNRWDVPLCEWKCFFRGEKRGGAELTRLGEVEIWS